MQPKHANSGTILWGNRFERKTTRAVGREGEPRRNRAEVVATKVVRRVIKTKPPAETICPGGRRRRND